MFAYVDTATLRDAAMVWRDATELESRLDGVTMAQAIRTECKHAISHILKRGKLEIPEMYIAPDIIAFMLARGVSFGHGLMTWVALHGHLDMAKALHEAGCDWNDDGQVIFFGSAVYNGHLDMVKYFHEIKPHFLLNGSITPCAIAAQEGQLDMLKYLHGFGYRLSAHCWAPNMSTLRINRLHETGVWKYLQDNGCP